MGLVEQAAVTLIIKGVTKTIEVTKEIRALMREYEKLPDDSLQVKYNKAKHNAMYHISESDAFKIKNAITLVFWKRGYSLNMQDKFVPK
jgi:hypothetical protein